MIGATSSASAWFGLEEYQPRRQFRAFHARKQRWATIVAHRRCGKTVACVADLVLSACLSKAQDARYAYVAPQYNQAKDVAWMYVKRLASDIPGVQFNESELRVDFANGARVRLYGADNPDRLRGLFLDGVLLDEYADMRPSVWGEVIRPMLSDRLGWAVFIGTPKGRNEFYEIWERAREDESWFSLMLRASETGIIPQSELDDARASMTPEQYSQEFECSFDAAILGAYYGRLIADAERDGRICDIEFEPVLPVHTAWDLGIGDSTAIWLFQVSPDHTVRILDHIENHGQPLSYYVAELAAKGHRYGTDYVPHDARARSLGTGRSILETLIEMKRHPQVLPAQGIEDRINAARVSFPRIWFDQRRCKFGLEALRQYRTEFDEKTKAFKNTPKHDWSSHSADAFSYLCMAWREMKAQPVKRQEPKTLGYTADPETGIIKSNFTISDMIKRNQRAQKRGL